MRAARVSTLQVLRTITTLLAMFVMATKLAALPPASALAEQVAAVVGRDLGIDSGVLQDQLQVLAPSGSVAPQSALHVVSFKREFAPGSWLIRLDCASRHDCLPFDAVLHLPEAKPTPSSSSPRAGDAPGLQHPAPLARSGERVELFAELSGVRLRTPAVCLQAGGLGDRIQVRNLSTHRVLVGTVAGEKLVRVGP